MGANPIGFAPISGMWIKVFVKALPFSTLKNQNILFFLKLSYPMLRL